MTTLTETALAQIEWIRTQYAEGFPDNPPDTAWLALGYLVPHGGPREADKITVGFFQRSEMNRVRRAGAVPCSGIRLIVLGTAAFKAAVANAVVDFEDGKGFLLREAQ